MVFSWQLGEVRVLNSSNPAARLIKVLMQVSPAQDQLIERSIVGTGSDLSAETAKAALELTERAIVLKAFREVGIFPCPQAVDPNAWFDLD